MGIFDWMYKDENEVEVKEQKQTINNIISQEDEEAQDLYFGYECVGRGLDPMLGYLLRHLR